MLQLSGTLKGKIYDNQVVSPEEFAELFGCPKNKTGNDVHTLELCQTHVNVDAFGQVKYTRSITQSAAYTLNIAGSLIEVRYYTSKVMTAPSQFKYLPDNIQFTGRSNDYTQSEYEKFLFLYASPMCANSPSSAQDPAYQHHDPQAIERAAEAKSLRFANLIQEIQEAPDSDIIAKSRGITVRGVGTNVAQNAGPALHRAALIRLLSQYQEDFEKAFREDTVLVRGLAREAMYKGGVQQKTINGRKAWVWGSNGTVILYFAESADPFTELVSWCLAPENYQYAKGQLTLAVSGQPVTPPELHPSDPPPPSGQKSTEIRATLEKGVSLGVIWKDESGKVCYNGANGVNELFDHPGEDWLDKLEKFVNTPGPNMTHRAAIKAVVNQQ